MLENKLRHGTVVTVATTEAVTHIPLENVACLNCFRMLHFFILNDQLTTLNNQTIVRMEKNVHA